MEELNGWVTPNQHVVSVTMSVRAMCFKLHAKWKYIWQLGPKGGRRLERVKIIQIFCIV